MISKAQIQHLTESNSAKFFVRSDGDTVVQNQGRLTDKEVRIIREFIKDNYLQMYERWAKMSPRGFYNG